MELNGSGNLVVSVTLNPCVDTVLFVDHLKIGDSSQIERIERDAGGKGVNFSRVLHKLGGNTLATGFIGGAHGAYVCAVLDSERVPHDFVSVSAETRNSFLIESGSGAPTSLAGRSPIISPYQLGSFKQELDLLIEGADWVAFGGSVPKGTPADIYRELIGIAKTKGCKVLLDADGELLRLGLEASPDLIKPNRLEAERLLGCSLERPEDVIAGAVRIRRDLIKRAGGDASYQPIVLISMGAEGAVISCSEGCYYGSSPAVKARSTVGSGDSMLAALIYALQQGETPDECLRFAMAAGAATALTNGSEVASRTLTLQLLHKCIVKKVTEVAC